MALVSFLKRRLFGRSSSLFKKLVIPAILVFLLVQYFGRSKDQKPPLENIIVPGEALDPILQNFQKNALKTQNILKKHKEEKVEKPNIYPLAQQKAKDEETPKIHTQQKEDKVDEDLKRINTTWSLYKANITDRDKVKFKPHAITELTVTLTLMSSSDKVFMSLNKKEIYRNLNDRGIHVVVINEYSGRVMAKRVFDTFSQGPEIEMVDFLDDIQDGRIIVFAVLDEASKGLTWKGRNKLKEYGARWADKIHYRDMWALVTRKGGLKLAETFSNVATADTGYEWGGPVFLRTDFDLIEKPKECDWPKTEKNDVRRRFCARYEGYGPLCSCEIANWEDVFFKANEKVHQELLRMPVYDDLVTVILASNRSHYLYKTLKSIWEAPGVNRDRIFIYGDEQQREVSAVAKLFNVEIVYTKIAAEDPSIRVRHKVQRILRDILGARFSEDTIPGGSFIEDSLPVTANHILILEDDIQVSIDVFKYFYNMVPLFNKDPTVLAISGFNNFGHRTVASSLTASYRTDNIIEIGLLLPSRTVHEVLAPNWYKTGDDNEWANLLKNSLKKGSAIVYPEVPRVHHFAYSGVLIQGIIQYNLFREQILSLTTSYEMDNDIIDGMILENYESRLSKTLNEGHPLHYDFCKHDLDYDTVTVNMFVSYNGSYNNNTEAWKYVMKCLNTWSIYPSMGWKNIWQFRFHGHLLNIVGVPASPYSNIMPSDYKIVTAPPTTTSSTSTTTTVTTGAVEKSASNTTSESKKILKDNSL